MMMTNRTKRAILGIALIFVRFVLNWQIVLFKLVFAGVGLAMVEYLVAHFVYPEEE